ncbi:MAG: energy transducer TonB [Proteobacteria bacterium]|nr:energy transducer TonB [Pseudomonadota bacterium]
MATVPSTASRPLEAAHSPAGAKRPSLELTAITTHDDFLLELGESLGGQAVVHPVESPEEALQSLGGGRHAGLLAIDARALPDTAAVVQILASRAPQATLLVFTDAAATEALGRSLKNSRVLAVLPIPIDARKTQAVIEGAAAQAAQAAPATQKAGITVAPHTLGSLAAQAGREASPVTPADARQPPPGPRRTVLIAAAAAAAVLAGGAAWYFLGHGKPAPVAAAGNPAAVQGGTAAAVPATAAPPAAPPAAQESGVESGVLSGKVDDLLEKARAAMHERRFTEPSGDNALLYYRSAVAAEPRSGEARDGLTRIAEVLEKRFDEALAASRLDEAAAALSAFRLAAPSDSRRTGFEQRLYTAAIGRALAEGNVDRAAVLLRQAQQSGSVPTDQITRWKGELTRRQDDARITRLATLAEERIREGHLDDGSDSANAYLQQLQAAAPTNANTQRVARALAAANQRKSKDAAEARARAASADSDRLLQQAAAQQAAARQAEAQQAAAQQAAARAAQPDLAALAQNLKRIDKVQAEYPAAAAARNISGNVIVGFTVDTRGITRDVQVLESTPQGVFDRAALAAVRRWRYTPATFNGTAVAVPVKTRVTFQLAQGQ